jgi:pimeloyl-ACP methyl ester carboxylesterase
MPIATSPLNVNGLDFHVEQSGSGDPLVLIHGSWGSTKRWSLIVDDLARSFHVVNYDRRGHGGSASSAEPATRIDQENDLAGLIEQLGIAPVHLVGSSFGAAMALSLAARRPDLVRSVCAHEPPFIGFAADHPAVVRASGEMAELVGLIEAGERERAARGFVERIAIGPGSWPMMPDEVREQMVRHADTFAGEMRDPAWGSASLDGIDCPVLITCGDGSPAWFTPTTAAAVDAIPHASLLAIAGAGHVPHVTHPDEYAEVLTRFAAAA